jgi:hypothetical protein
LHNGAGEGREVSFSGMPVSSHDQALIAWRERERERERKIRERKGVLMAREGVDKGGRGVQGVSVLFHSLESNLLFLR